MLVFLSVKTKRHKVYMAYVIVTQKFCNYWTNSFTFVSKNHLPIAAISLAIRGSLIHKTVLHEKPYTWDPKTGNFTQSVN